MARARTPGSERARRLVALMSHFRRDERYRVSELAELVGTTEQELTADLTTLSLCGVAPYYPNDYVPVIVEDGIVEVFGDLPALSGPVRLSSAEARALAAALEAAGFSATDELTVRLLDAAAGATFDATELERTVRAAASEHDRDIFESVAEALEERRVLTIAYQGAADQDPRSRDIEPLSLFAERGVWYLTAWCRDAAAWRTFRVDRIRSAETTAEHSDPSSRDGAPTADSFPVAGLPSATLRFASGEPFEEREWPGGRVLEQTTDGDTLVDVPFAGTAWVARRVVARQGAVEVLAPPEMRVAVSKLARELLDGSR